MNLRTPKVTVALALLLTSAVGQLVWTSKELYSDGFTNYTMDFKTSEDCRMVMIRLNITGYALTGLWMGIGLG